jgi:CheY-like chemotaxis protein/anti-sigma regulatory factor (Ser/Thr protein kinase)
MADPVRLEQVCWNLLNNAIKFTPAGGTITIRTSNPGDGRIRIQIADTGKGIDPDSLTTIFNPFEQGGTEMTRRYGGLGLGLAIAKAIVEMHEGTISATSEGPGTGATFTVEMATTAREPAPAGRDGESGRPVTAARQTDPAPRILLVEDHQSTSFVLQRLMKRWGWDVVPEVSVKSALELADSHSFDLVISDLGLPDGTGYELMRQLRDRYGLQGIALSGYGMDQDIQKSLASGFVAHLVKPVNFDELRSAVVTCLAGAGRDPAARAWRS